MTSRAADASWQSIASRWREVTFSPPLGSGETGLDFVSSFGLPSSRRTGQVQQRAMTMIKGLEHLAHEERLRQLGIFIPCRRDVFRALISVLFIPDGRK